MRYILALNPLLQTLHQNKGVQILRHVEPATAYADDGTIFLNSRQDVTPTTRTLLEYSRSSDAQINIKSQKRYRSENGIYQ